MIKEISVAKELVALIGRDADADIDVIIADAVLELLTRAEQKKPQPAVGGVTPELEKKQPEIKQKPAAAKRRQKKEKFDTGKMIALLEGGWSIAKIADEMGVSDQTIRNHMQKEGIRLKSKS